MRISSKVVMRVLAIVVSSLLIVFAIVIYLDKTRNVLFFPSSKKQVHKEVTELFNSLLIGMSKQDSLHLIHNFTKDKSFIINDNNHTIQVISPHDYSLTWSWTINIILNEESNTIQGLAIRPIDDVSYFFCDAPPDKGVISKKFEVTHKNCIE